MSIARGEPFEAFFLPALHGKRFCVFYPAARAPRGAVLYVHPFAEEMNRSRRMAALQSRKLAALGFAVLQIDLLGCGDSSGDFGDARWELWKEDVALGADWLRQRVGDRIHLWGLRLGAALALDYAVDEGKHIAGILMWQPVLSGETFLTQFLRLRVASEMLSAGQASSGTQALRSRLNAGETLEIAGYEIAPDLARAIDRLKLADLAPRGLPAHWLEVVSEQGRGIPPAAQRTVDAWLKGGVRLEVQCVAGQAFWSTLEITECAPLIAATTNVLAEGSE